MTDLVIRPLTSGEQYPYDVPEDAIGYRPEWMWVAERDGVAVAGALWHGPADATEPALLDKLDITDVDAAAQLLREANHRAEYTLLLPPNWQDDPAAKADAMAHIEAARAAGYELLVERYRYRWTPDCGLPARPGRLELRPEPDDEVFFEVFRRLHVGSLDAHTQHAIANSGVEMAAREELEIALSMPSPREWWRLGYTPDGELAGLILPSHNPNHPIIGYVGVVPEQRGHGYAYELLAEGTHFLAAQGFDRIVAATDVTNTPMAAAFAKAGYPVWHYRMDFVWPDNQS